MAKVNKSELGLVIGIVCYIGVFVGAVSISDMVAPLKAKQARYEPKFNERYETIANRSVGLPVNYFFEEMTLMLDDEVKAFQDYVESRGYECRK